MTVDDHLVTALCRAAERDHGDVDTVVRSHLRRVAPLVGPTAGEALVRAAVARLDGLGSLDALLADDAVDEVLVNSSGDIWIERDGRLERAGHLAAGDLGVVVERILAPLGRRLDRLSPVVDARLPDGSRVCAVIPPVAPDGACLAVRRFRDRALPLDAFAGDTVGAVLDVALIGRCNVVVSGATSSGKTSLLNTVLGRTAPGERIVTIEDTAELLPSGDHLVRLEARPATPDGPSAISLEGLVRTALRLRPDRLVVGEVRGPEVLALVQALNTGHDGSWSTCHANSALDALHRLETLVIQAAPAWPLLAVRQHLTRSIDVVVHLARRDDGSRRVVEIGEVVVDAERLQLRPIVTGEQITGRITRVRAMSPAMLALVATVAAILLVGARVRAGVTLSRRPGPVRLTLDARSWARRLRRRDTPVGDIDVARWCERVASRVRAGRSLTQAVVDADGATAVAHRPFVDVAHALARGRSLADALAGVDDGPASAVGLLTSVMIATAELGGSAAGPLDRVAGTLLARAAEREERITGSAQARLSARVLTVLPFGVLVALAVGESTIRAALSTPAGVACLALGAVANGLGWWWMHHIIGGVA